MRYDVVKIKKGRITSVINSSMDMQLAVRGNVMHMLYVIRYITSSDLAVSCSVTYTACHVASFVQTIDIEPEPGNNAVQNMHMRTFKVCLGRVFIATCKVKYSSNGTELRMERY